MVAVIWRREKREERGEAGEKEKNLKGEGGHKGLEPWRKKGWGRGF